MVRLGAAMLGFKTLLMGASTALAFSASALAAAAPKPVAAEPNSLQAAVVKVEITPSDLTNLNAFGGGSYLAVHDPIFARVLLLSSGGKTALIVTYDAPEVGDMVPFRQRIERETGIKFDHIILAATHDHSAPRIGGLSKGTRAQMPSAESFRYSETVYEKTLAAIKSAKAALRPAKMGYGRTHLDINVNRDQYTPGKGWGMGYDPDGVSDNGLPVIRIDGTDGKAIAILFAYGVHSTATFGIKHVSGDLAGAAERHIETYGSPGVVGMFLMGPAGEQIPIVSLGRVSEDDTKMRDLAFRASDAQGLILGASVLRLASGIKAEQTQVRIAAANRDTVCATKETPNQNMATLSAEKSPEVTIKLSALLLGDVAIAGVGGEVVTPIFQRFMKQTPLVKTIFATNVNDRIGYIANDAAYDPTFEVNGSPAAKGCAEAAIADGLSDMIAKLVR
jgi:neutral ceramidase